MTQTDRRTALKRILGGTLGRLGENWEGLIPRPIALHDY